jgi:hypothetical protein
MKFKVGDKVRANKDCTNDIMGGEGVIEHISPDGTYCEIRMTKASIYYKVGDVTCNTTWPRNIELIKEHNNMARRTFRLKKDTYDLKKGALFQEACDDGDQKYVLLNGDSFYRWDDWRTYWDDVRQSVSRNGAENNPEWFEEVFPASQEWLTAEEVEEFKEFRQRKTVKVPSKSKYPFLSEMKVNDEHKVKTSDASKIMASAVYFGESNDRKFKRKKLNKIYTSIVRVK